jgi:small subunit ribosomal protein S11
LRRRRKRRNKPWRRHRARQPAPRPAGKGKKFKKRERKNVPFGLVFIQASFNNTIVTITDQQGNTLSWKIVRLAWLPRLPQGNPVCRAAGRRGAANAARDHGMRSVDVRVSGPGSGRESAIRALADRRHRGPQYPRRYAHAAQRLPSAEAPSRVVCFVDLRLFSDAVILSSLIAQNRCIAFAFVV